MMLRIASSLNLEKPLRMGSRGKRDEETAVWALGWKRGEIHVLDVVLVDPEVRGLPFGMVA